MDIPSLSMGLARNNVLNSVGTAILSQSLDQAASIGNAVTEMIDSAAMERSVCPEIGGNIDISI